MSGGERIAPDSPALDLDTVLVANRGEIACRVIRTAKAMGMRTVAVFSDADRAAPHVREADEAVRLGPAAPRESYLRIEAIIAAARATGAGLIHPGYGFLSENLEFASACEEAGIRFVGPTADQILAFGAKHTARELAEAAGVPLLAGTGLLTDADDAVAQAERIGLPVMLKATGGGGGIGMQACATPDEVREAFGRVTRLAESAFGSTGIFLERLVRPARHVEVQLVGDGEGRVAVIGDRDCSLQRRNQKVIEEAPAPALPDRVRAQLHDSARALAESVSYRSAGTVEFVYDPVREEAAFLEVNTRLQVEHPVTEEVHGVDLVELMLRLARDGAAGLPDDLFTREWTPSGHAVEARVYAEDPAKGSLPSSGLVTQAVLAEGPGIRVDGWIETGLEVSASYDPLLAKVIATGETRDDALDLLGEALDGSRIDGIVTNIGLLRALTDDLELRTATHSTSTLDETDDPAPRIDVISPGTMTTVQDLPGRLGYWQVGVPPSGPFDPVSLAEANLAVGNPEGAPGLEITADGPVLRFSTASVVAVTGAPAPVTIDGSPAAMWEPLEVAAGQTLAIGRADGPGLRLFLAVRGGIDVPAYLGSASTFTLGRFGGHAGRALLAGDVLRPGSPDSDADHPAFPAGARLGIIGGPTPAHRRPALTSTWEVGVTEGPHAAPDFFTRADIDVLYATDYGVHHNSARTGIRLIGPRPGWAREDGGEAGLHPSNIHDTPYAVGAIDFTGDTPIILGPDGPSLGGFVCPAVVASGELWKLGQLRPGDTVRFVPVTEAAAASLVDARSSLQVIRAGGDGDDGVIGRLEPTDARPGVAYRRDGDDNVLVEYGDMTLDIALRMRVHALMTRLQEHMPPGVLEVTPGIRSLQVRTDARVLKATAVTRLLQELEDGIPPTGQLVVPSRKVRLPLSWDDPATRLAIERYMAGVRDDAPWTPWNIEFIRRINGLDSVDDVFRTVFDASYLVLGLGDVYLGAPVATPLDPRHRLVTTKYNPARTWTAENSVGIGGAYLCIYGMEGPGGYQFVGRTVQIWNRFRRGGLFQEDPWALRFFDRIEWYPVGAEELLELRAETDAGRGHYETEDGEFSIADHHAFLAANDASIRDFRATQTRAFEEEKARWRLSGEFDVRDEPPVVEAATVAIPPGATAVTAPFTSTVWRVDVRPGDDVSAGDAVLAVEAMKMESVVGAPVAGRVLDVHIRPGEQVAPGQVLAVIGAAS
ncbi:urea carboxylase [Clavibacter michiganensis]|uniref:Acetyl-/propionyl-coenzyme A carboxylase alpha chain n=1 Tax=Clavibacter michiganensis TaxID=28447 RepID=A0A251YHU6_9MICO|nr:urea carboxylase [Clavibacter michiganensis]OUE23794.1 Acetyl-/propionyl-coenzyme A carboxylase alpha chain [Clavibacter michiganensis]